MMLTLDEAITRFTALSKANRSKAESYNRGEDYELMKAKECETCADECDQVASWLKELNRYRGKITKAYWIEYSNNHYYCSNCDNLRDVHDYYCEHCGCEMFDDDGNIVITKGGPA